MTGQNVTRYVRYSSKGETHYGILEGNAVHQIAGEPWSGGGRTGVVVPRADAKLHLPVDPDLVGKVICLFDGYNKPGESRHQPHPYIGPKMQTALIPDGELIQLIPETPNPAHGGSLVLIIGKKGRNVSIAEAPSLVFGVAVGNDVTMPQWLDSATRGFMIPDRILAKSIDTFGPLGTQIVTGVDYNDLEIVTRVNGKVAARGRTSQMINNVAKLVHYISHYCTLEPGDVIYTGSPIAEPGMETFQVGDAVEVEIENVGKVRNVAIAGQASPNPWWTKMQEELAAAAPAS
jgi:2-keto-4-pentenoate hydratase/2-oxohepta-3-ene-1,7-dioic acid hydratase in catechol pathway